LEYHALKLKLLKRINALNKEQIQSSQLRKEDKGEKDNQREVL